MLIKLIQNDETIKALKEQCVDIYNFHKEKYCIDVIANGDNLEYYYYPLNKCDDTTDAPEGFYLAKCKLIEISQTKIPENHRISIESFGKFDKEGYFEGRWNTGYCNKWEDIIDNYPELLESNRNFVVIFDDILHDKGNGFMIDDDFEGEYLPNGMELGNNQNYIIEYTIYEFVEIPPYEKFFTSEGYFKEEQDPYRNKDTEFYKTFFDDGDLKFEAYLWLEEFIENPEIEAKSEAVALYVCRNFLGKLKGQYNETFYWR